MDYGVGLDSGVKVLCWDFMGLEMVAITNNRSKGKGVGGIPRIGLRTRNCLCRLRRLDLRLLM